MKYTIKPTHVDLIRHGVIREVEAATGYSMKKPCEVVLHANSRTIWLYDVQASIKLAKQYGWVVSGNNAALLQEKLGRHPSKKQIIAEAVRLDIESCRARLAALPAVQNAGRLL